MSNSRAKVFYDKHIMLSLEGEDEDVKRFIRLVKPEYYPVEQEDTTDLSFNRLLPVPVELLDDCTKKEEWCIKHWGIAVELEFSFEEEAKVYECIIPGMHQLPFVGLQAMSRKFPNIVFKVSYEYWQFSEDTLKNGGKIIFKDGQIVNLTIGLA